MEPFSLLIIFGAMIAIWWFTWQPWKKRSGDELSQGAQDQNNDGRDAGPDGPR